MKDDTQKLIEDYLKNGGKITKLPTKFEHCPTFLQYNNGITVKATKPSGLATAVK